MTYNRLVVAQKKAKHVFDVYRALSPERYLDENVAARALGLYRKTKVPCSCPACGHQRKHFGPTVQERRLNQKED
jgi:hypothetical protein